MNFIRRFLNLFSKKKKKEPKEKKKEPKEKKKQPKKVNFVYSHFNRDY